LVASFTLDAFVVEVKEKERRCNLKNKSQNQENLQQIVFSNFELDPFVSFDVEDSIDSNKAAPQHLSQHIEASSDWDPIAKSITKDFSQWLWQQKCKCHYSKSQSKT